jgi:uncharacterized membrane protein
VAALLEMSGAGLSEKDRRYLEQMIRKAEQEGR